MRHLRTQLTQRYLLLIAIGLLGLLTLPAVALADSISPSSFSCTGPTGFTCSVHKHVTVSAGTPSTAQADIFFLADTTGSMGGVNAAVKASASTILTSLSGLGNIQFGVGEYKDVGDVYIYRLNQGMTASIPTAQAGINLWGASGGGDAPEAQLFALQSLATDPATGWRAGSKRILVWFGDAPGHDPSNGATEATATAALVAKNIQVEAIDVGALNSTGQAARIAAATGGSYFAGINTDTIVAAIINAIGTAFANYSSVCLSPEGNAPNVDVSSSPDCYVGRFDRSIDRTFEFEVTFHDLVPGDHSFVIHALVDGGIVATEEDRIISLATPEPASLLLVGVGLLGLAAAGRGLRRRK